MINYSRQEDIFDPTQWYREVHILGLGGIGSTCLLQMMNMGVPLVHIYDGDSLEGHNIPYQPLYRPSDASNSLLKVDAAQQYAKREEKDTKIVKHPIFITEETENLALEGFVLCAFDTLDARRLLWYNHVKGNGLIECYVDGRIGGDKLFQVHAFNPSDPRAVKKYESWLKTPANGEARLPYGVAGINYPSYLLAGLVGHILALLYRGESFADLLIGNLGAVKITGDRKTPVVYTL